MYAAYFGLRDYPFAITPDPSYVYMSPRHQEALAHLLYGMGEHGGFVQLTGEVGTGKTTLIRTLLSQHFDEVDIALSLNPRLTVQEFVAAICDELHVEYPEAATLKQLVDALNQHLLQAHAQGRRTVLIIDEAQNLSFEVLEQVRLLTNLETHKHKLLRIILVGQPELQNLLEREDLRQLAQRITARYHLSPLTRRDALAYIEHRLSVAGARQSLFSRSALNEVYRITKGVPRLINVICDRALLAAYASNCTHINRPLLREAAYEALHGTGQTQPRQPKRSLGPWLLLGALLLSLALLALALPHWQPVWQRWFSGEPISNPAHIPDTAPVAVVPNPPEQPAVVAAQPPPDPMLTLRNAYGDPRPWLAQQWGLGFNLGGDFCAWARDQNLRCLDGQLTWDEMVQFNLPLVLSLRPNPEGRVEVVLEKLADQQAWVRTADGKLLVLGISQLQSLWAGDYTLLWRPLAGEELISARSRGEVVRSVRQLLSNRGLLPATAANSERYDNELSEAIRRFQQGHHLSADGVAGARTQILLAQPDPALPSLSAR